MKEYKKSHHCPICSITFKSKKYLDIHEKKKHSVIDTGKF